MIASTHIPVTTVGVVAFVVVVVLVVWMLARNKRDGDDLEGGKPESLSDDHP